MKLYCFDDPSDPTQRLAIRKIGSVENEIQQNFIKMSDCDKLMTTRRNWQDSVERGVTGLFQDLSHFFLGGQMKKEIARTLGLLKENSTEAKGTVSHLYALCFGVF